MCCACNIVMWGRFAVICNELVTAETSSFCMRLHHRSKLEHNKMYTRVYHLNTAVSRNHQRSGSF